MGCIWQEPFAASSRGRKQEEEREWQKVERGTNFLYKKPTLVIANSSGNNPFTRPSWPNHLSLDPTPNSVALEIKFPGHTRWGAYENHSTLGQDIMAFKGLTCKTRRLK
jgi:hypothetical protein